MQNNYTRLINKKQIVKFLLDHNACSNEFIAAIKLLFKKNSGCPIALDFPEFLKLLTKITPEQKTWLYYKVFEVLRQSDPKKFFASVRNFMAEFLLSNSYDEKLVNKLLNHNISNNYSKSKRLRDEINEYRGISKINQGLYLFIGNLPSELYVFFSDIFNEDGVTFLYFSDEDIFNFFANYKGEK